MEFSETEIKALAQGDTKVFHKLYEHFFVALCIFARSFSLKPEEAEDIVQEVFCRMYDEHRLYVTAVLTTSGMKKDVQSGKHNS